MIKTPALLDSVRDLKDRSGKLSFVTPELSDPEFIELRSFRGLQGWLLFSLNSIDESEIPQEEAYVDTKSPSQRLRNTLYVYWEQNKGELPQATFDEFYQVKMEGIINMIKNKLQ